MELRPLSSPTPLTARPSAAPARTAGPPDRLETREQESPGTYGPSFAKKSESVPSPNRTALKTAGFALATVVAAALVDSLLGGGLHKSHD